jgi:type I restriction enzyme S subunit
MKDSGVDWLGEIPAHWDTSRLGRFWSVQGGFAFPSSWFLDEGVAVIRMSNLKSGKVNLDGASHVTTERALPEFALGDGDILVGMSGSLGNYAEITAEALPAQLNQRVGRFILRQSGLCRSFLLNIVQTGFFAEGVRSSASGTAQLNISPSSYGSITVTLPPLNEQHDIAAYIDRESSRIDALITRYRREIELMQEYRTRLISDVVTGKLDVRGVNLPPVEAVVIEGIEAAMANEGVEEIVDEFEEVEA